MLCKESPWASQWAACGSLPIKSLCNMYETAALVQRECLLSSLKTCERCKKGSCQQVLEFPTRLFTLRLLLIEVQAVPVASKGFLHSHRDFQPGQLPILLQTALEPACGLHLFSCFWTAKVLGGERSHLLS